MTGSAPPLRLLTFGRFELHSNAGTAVSLPTRKAEVLLAYMALTPGAAHPRERLSNLLWSSRGEEQARNSLRHALSSIRKALGEAHSQVLQVDRSAVTVRPGTISIDAMDLSVVLDGACELHDLKSAAELYRGEFLEGVSVRDRNGEEWLAGERERYRKVASQTFMRLLAGELEAGQWDAGIATGERLVGLDPFNESAWRSLMRAYAAGGQRNQALLAFKRCSDLLTRELGVAPEPETMAVRDEIRTGTGHGEPAPPMPATPTSEAPAHGPGTSQPAPVVLVSPFATDDARERYFSDGVTDSVILALGQFANLRVLSRYASLAIPEGSLTVAGIRQQFGADYLVEGSLRRSSDRLRLNVKLIDTRTGSQAWGHRYDAPLHDIFAVEEELTRKIAATVSGRIETLEVSAAFSHPRDMDVYDDLVRGMYHTWRFTRTDHEQAVTYLNRCIARDPGNVRAHYWLFCTHIVSWVQRWTEDADKAFELAGEHAARAVEIAPDDSSALAFCAEHAVFRNDLSAARQHIERAQMLNANDINVLAVNILLCIASGDFQAAERHADLCGDIDPYHPWSGWFRGEAYFTVGRYEDAAAAFQSIKDVPFAAIGEAAAAHWYAGNESAAQQCMHVYVTRAREEMAILPATLDEWREYWFDMMSYLDDRLNRQMFDAMVKIGLGAAIEQPENPATEAAALPTPSADLLIVVLPFENLSSDPEFDYFAAGITEGVILALTRFGSCKVMSRVSAVSLVGRSAQSIGEELGARFVVEGSAKRTPDRVRVRVQLVDAANGSPVWGDSYESELEDVFTLEENLSGTLAATISGRADRETQAVAMRKPARDVRAYDLLLRGEYLCTSFKKPQVLAARDLFRQCLARDPDNPRALIGLYQTHFLAWVLQWTDDDAKDMREASRCISRALEIAPDDALAHANYADYCAHTLNYADAERHLDLAIKLNPNDAMALQTAAIVHSMMGDHDRALAFARTSRDLDPYHPWMGWTIGIVYFNARKYTESIALLKAIVHPLSEVSAWIAANYAQLGELDLARRYMREFLRDMREEAHRMPSSEAQWREYWQTEPYRNDGDREHLIDALLKAGLCEEQAAPETALQ